MRDAQDRAIISRAQAEAAQLSTRRAGIIDHLIPLVGLEPNDTAYQDAVYRYDPPARRRALALHQSGCGLVMEYGWEGGGVPVDDRIKLGADVRGVRGGLLYPITLDILIAQASGAWVDCSKGDPGRRPLPGDGMIMGCSSCRGVWSKGQAAYEHASTVACVDRQVSGESDIISGIDGGQPGVHVRTRALVLCGPRGDELWCAWLDAEGAYQMDATDMRPVKGRRLLGFVDVDRLPEAA